MLRRTDCSDSRSETAAQTRATWRRAGSRIILGIPQPGHGNAAVVAERGHLHGANSRRSWRRLGLPRLFKKALARSGAGSLRYPSGDGAVRSLFGVSRLTRRHHQPPDPANATGQ
jgi:hypothetical protein